jgi:hypothetical protein
VLRVDATDIARETERLALVIVLREHPEWSLADLLERMEADDPRAAALRRLTVRELMTDPGIPRVRLVHARRASGPAFDELVYRVIVEAGRSVGASRLRAHLGGPRRKLQASLARLVAAGRITRIGTTSNSRYGAARS